MPNGTLLNFDKTASKKIGTDTAPTAKFEKKEGGSLFESLMNEAKTDSLSKDTTTRSLTTAQQTVNKEDPKNQNKNDSQNLSSIQEKNSTKTQSQATTPLTNGTTQDLNKKLVDNLVNKVVDQVKEVQKNKSDTFIEKNNEVKSDKTFISINRSNFSKENEVNEVKTEKSSVDINSKNFTNKSEITSEKTPVELNSNRKIVTTTSNIRETLQSNTSINDEAKPEKSPAISNNEVKSDKTSINSNTLSTIKKTTADEVKTEKLSVDTNSKDLTSKSEMVSEKRPIELHNNSKKVTTTTTNIRETLQNNSQKNNEVESEKTPVELNSNRKIVTTTSNIRETLQSNISINDEAKPEKSPAISNNEVKSDKTSINSNTLSTIKETTADEVKTEKLSVDTNNKDLTSKSEIVSEKNPIELNNNPKIRTTTSNIRETLQSNIPIKIENKISQNNSPIELQKSEIVDPIQTKTTQKSLNENVSVIEKSVENISTDVKNIVNNLDSDTQSIKNDFQIDALIKKFTDNSTEAFKSNIVQEVIVIKDAVGKIKNELNETLYSVKDLKNVNGVPKKDIEELHQNNTKIVETITEKTILIEDSVDEIKNIVDTKSLVSNDNNRNSENNPIKIEDKVEIIKEVLSDIKEDITNIVVVRTTDIQSDQTGSYNDKKPTSNNTINILAQGTTNIDDSKTPFLASVYLNTQKNLQEKTSMVQINDAKNIILEKKTIQSVKESGQKLDLNIEEVNVDSTKESGKKIDSTATSKEATPNTNLMNNRSLSQVLFNQKIESKQLIKEQSLAVAQQEIIFKSTLSTVADEKVVDTVEIVVPKDTAEILQTKIIGAQQKVSSFMSDVARNMYLNYKPPVTAFRVNLNPANLGSISIIMKSNKVDNTLSVSMNLSNSNTMEAFTENKAVLQNAILRQFNDTPNVSINFGMHDQSSENSFNQSQQEQNKQQENNNTQSTNRSDENVEETEIIEHNDYM